jgi:hypothetical protein
MAQKTTPPPGGVWATRSVPIETEPCKYDHLVVLLEHSTPGPLASLAGTRASSYQALRGQNMVASSCPQWLQVALSVLGGHTSNAASEGCHSIAQLIMSDLQTSMADDFLQMTVCLRDGKEAQAVEQLPVEAIYPGDSEAKNTELDITATSNLLELEVQSR